MKKYDFKTLQDVEDLLREADACTDRAEAKERAKAIMFEALDHNSSIKTRVTTPQDDLTYEEYMAIVKKTDLAIYFNQRDSHDEENYHEAVEIRINPDNTLTEIWSDQLSWKRYRRRVDFTNIDEAYSRLLIWKQIENLYKFLTA